MTPPRPDFADCLEKTLAEAFRLLTRGAADRRSPMHTPTLATIDATGAPSVRTLVLRSFDPQQRLLRFHSDRRAGKIGEIAADPRLALHFYHPQACVQLRLRGIGEIHSDPSATESAWQGSRPMSRICYATDIAPGSTIAAPLAAPTDEAAGRRNFALLLVRFDRLEWLWLHADGHRRARFAWRDDGLTMEWLAP